MDNELCFDSTYVANTVSSAFNICMPHNKNRASSIMGRKLEASINLASTVESDENFSPRILFKAPPRNKPHASKHLNSSLYQNTAKKFHKNRANKSHSVLGTKSTYGEKSEKISHVIQEQKEALLKSKKLSRNSVNYSNIPKTSIAKTKSSITYKPSDIIIDSIIKRSVSKERERKAQRKLLQLLQEEEKLKKCKKLKEDQIFVRLHNSKSVMKTMDDADERVHKIAWGIDQRKFSKEKIRKSPVLGRTRMTVKKVKYQTLVEHKAIEIKPKKQTNKKLQIYIKKKRQQIINNIKKVKQQKSKKKQLIEKNINNLTNYIERNLSASSEKKRKSKEIKDSKEFKELKPKSSNGFYDKYIKLYKQIESDTDENQNSENEYQSAQNEYKQREWENKIMILTAQASAARIQRAFKKYRNNKKRKLKKTISVVTLDIPPTYELQENMFYDEPSSKSKVVQLSTINIAEVNKQSTPQNKVKYEQKEVQTDSSFKKPKLMIDTSQEIIKESLIQDERIQKTDSKLYDSSSIIDLKNLWDSEQLNICSSSKEPTPKSTKSYKEEDEKSEKNEFNDITYKKYRNALKEDSFAKILKMREKIFKLKESSEKVYIKKLFEGRKLSPKTYFNKRTELDKWVIKEREEIKVSKKQISEQYKKAKQMIEEAHQNAVMFKKLLSDHKLSKHSEFGIYHSLTDRNPKNEFPIDDPIKIEQDYISRQSDIEPFSDNIQINIIEDKKPKAKENYEDVSPVPPIIDEKQKEEGNDKHDTVQEIINEEKLAVPIKIVDTVEQKERELHEEELKETKIHQKVVTEKIVDDITNDIIGILLSEVSSNMFPSRKIDNKVHEKVQIKERKLQDFKCVKLGKEEISVFMDCLIDVIFSNSLTRKISKCILRTMPAY